MVVEEFCFDRSCASCCATVQRRSSGVSLPGTTNPTHVSPCGKIRFGDGATPEVEVEERM